MNTLLVIEGLDGSGKSTQSKLIAAHLEIKMIPCRRIHFPNYEDPSSTLVTMYLNGEFGKNPIEVNPYAASIFYASDRFSSYEKYWKEDYKAGKVILTDRYVSSNIIYQMSKLPNEEWDGYLNWLFDLEYNKLRLPQPNKVIYLHMPRKIADELLDKRCREGQISKDIHEQSKPYLLRCEEAAIYMAQKYKYEVVECATNGGLRTKEEIFRDIVQKIGDVVTNP